VAGVVIGIDPHKGSHTAVALDVHERQLGRLRVRASSRQVDGLLEWASGWPRRRWAIEGARGLGQLLAQQLIAAGERVLDVPPKLAARVRLLDSGQINNNDPNDARSVAVAALRAHELPELAAEDHAMVMRVWARRYHDLARLRTQVVCRLHAVVCELVPGGVRKYLRATASWSAATTGSKSYSRGATVRMAGRRRSAEQAQAGRPHTRGTNSAVRGNLRTVSESHRPSTAR